MLQKTLYISIFTLLLIGCGKNDSNKDRIMEIGESYTVSKGDVVIKNSEDTLVKIIHTDGKKSSSIFLLEGNATITHPKKQSK